MKKFIVIALIAIMAVGSIFAVDLQKMSVNAGYGYNVATTSAANGRFGKGDGAIKAGISYEADWATCEETKNFLLGIYVNADLGIPTTSFTALMNQSGAAIAPYDKVSDCSLEALVGFNAVLRLGGVFSLQGVIGPTYQLANTTSIVNSSFGAGGALIANFDVTDGFALAVGVQGAWYPSWLACAQELRDGKVDSFSDKVFLSGSYKF